MSTRSHRVGPRHAPALLVASPGQVRTMLFSNRARRMYASLKIASASSPTCGSR
ncbi:hypothetical protein [Nannocystis punicea]|uniref:Uncharacterized protein n=1 Tax=Nannocystis punicea TaxID=2995304 RepID=A0ABY7H7Q6_9BACT|nr:hypothetical protein [Nannocystis poenicansa]WAS95193.1 hypothetical protein O0S08_03445 [Nannocystis poenicansa]